MNLIDQADAEMKLANYTPDERYHVRDLMRHFFDVWNSGGAVSVALPVFTRLIGGLPLSPLTGEDSEWTDPMGDGKLLQNKRCMSVFKDTKADRCFDVDAPPLFGFWIKAFPYMPEHRTINTTLQIVPQDPPMPAASSGGGAMTSTGVITNAE